MFVAEKSATTFGDLPDWLYIPYNSIECPQPLYFPIHLTWS